MCNVPIPRRAIIVCDVWGCITISWGVCDSSDCARVWIYVSSLRVCSVCGYCMDLTPSLVYTVLPRPQAECTLQDRLST